MYGIVHIATLSIIMESLSVLTDSEAKRPIRLWGSSFVLILDISMSTGSRKIIIRLQVLIAQGTLSVTETTQS